MQTLLRTPNSAADKGNESSVFDLHPIQHAAPASSHAIPVLLSLLLTPFLIFEFLASLSPARFLQAPWKTKSNTGQSVSVLLQEPIVRYEMNPPARPTFGLKGPGGLGHREGTSTLDPRLADVHTTLAMPSDAIDPEELSHDRRADLVLLSLDPTLPLEVGGNGLSRGIGRDATPGPDHRLVSIHQVTIFHHLTPKEESEPKQPVRIRLLIGESGVPYKASVVSGPNFLRKEALKAALEWRFEPLRFHGLDAPVSAVLIFWPAVLAPPSRPALEATAGP
jgi:hypothetical protein